MRVDGWQDGLSGLVQEWRGKPFEWGKTDCACLVRAAVKTIRGRDLWLHWPEYSSPRSAKAALKLQGYEGLSQVLSTSFMRIAPQYAMTGDIVLLPGVSFGACGVVIDTKLAQMGRDGLVLVPMQHMGQAWRV